MTAGPFGELGAEAWQAAARCCGPQAPYRLHPNAWACPSCRSIYRYDDNAGAGMPAEEFRVLVDTIGRLASTAAAVVAAWRACRIAATVVSLDPEDRRRREAREDAAWDRLIPMLDELDELVGAIEAERAVRLLTIAAGETGPAG